MKKAPRSGKFTEEGSRLRAAPRGDRRRRESDGRERRKETRRPDGFHHLRAPAHAASQARTGPRLPAGDLPAYRLVGQLAHAIELLLHLGPAAALARELGKDGAARSPPQGYMAPVWSLRGDGSSTAEPRGAFWPARGSFPRAPPPTPPPATAPAAASSSCAPQRLHSNAWGSLRRLPGPHRTFAPQPQSRAGTRESPQAGWPAGRVVPAAPVRRAPCILGLVVSRPGAHLSSVQSLQAQWVAEVGESGSAKGFALFSCVSNIKMEPRI